MSTESTAKSTGLPIAIRNWLVLNNSTAKKLFVFRVFWLEQIYHALIICPSHSTSLPNSCLAL